jgi:TolB-like protein
MDAPVDNEESAWDKLSRRKVVQWATVYAAGAWGFLQVLEYVSGTFEWPRELQRFATLAALVGLPVVFVLAWYHGDRQRRRLGAAGLVILALLFLVGGAFLWRYERALESPSSASAAGSPPGATASVTAPVAARSIAVLPFANLSDDPENEYFADGLAEEILNSLAQVADLKVTGRTSSFAFKGRNEDLRRIGEALGVATVLEGSVRRAGDRVRVTTQLVRVADGFHLWSQTYDRTLTDVFAIQLDIAQNVAEVLEVVLDDAQRQRMRDAGVKNAEAFVAFQKGRALYAEAHMTLTSRPLVEILADANREFARATQLEPDLARAHLLAADLYTHQLQRTDIAATARLEAIASIREQLAQASETAKDPLLRALVDLERQFFSDDWSGLAERARAAAELPGCVEGGWGLAVLFPYGLIDAFERIVARQRVCDPLSHEGWAGGLWVAASKGEPAAVLDLARQMRAQLGPSRELVAAEVRALVSLGRLDEARATLSQLSPGASSHALATLLVAEAEGRDPAELREQLAELLAAMPPAAAQGSAKVLLPMRVNLYAGDRETNNRVAAEVDSLPGGPFVLAVVGERCGCGAPWDIERTPNLRQRLAEAGLTWPPPDLRPAGARLSVSGSRDGS